MPMPTLFISIYMSNISLNYVTISLLIIQTYPLFFLVITTSNEVDELTQIFDYKVAKEGIVWNTVLLFVYCLFNSSFKCILYIYNKMLIYKRERRKGEGKARGRGWEESGCGVGQ